MSNFGTRYKLSNTLIKKLTVDNLNGKPTRDYWDTESRTLILRLSKRYKTFYCKIDKGMSYLGRFTLDSAPDSLTLEQAREKANINAISSKGAKHNGFVNLSLEGYLDNFYVKDRKLLGRVVGDDTINLIKREFKALLSKRLKDICNDDMIIWRGSKSAVKDATKRRSYVVFRSLFNTLVEKKYIKENPIDKMTFNIGNTEKIAYHNLDYDAASSYIDSLNTSDEGKFVVLSIMLTGARPIEIIRSNCTQYTKVTDNEYKVEYISAFSKNSTSRTVHVNNSIYSKYLERLLLSYSLHSKGYSSRLMNSIKDKSGNPIHREFTTSVYRPTWDLLKAKFDLNGRLYDLRHTFASRVFKNTSNIAGVAYLLGDSISTATKYYVSMDSEETRKLTSNLK
ncbi:tyrosine-type recombinase/integrase [Paraglaciecola sp. L3A3]|uniref:tyrosine-type recombinase/integrase n=1 Tax=Paraglaciecola sp. L3A3 TaxID=2686358 RepID=UPI00131BD38D|nr:tyrosine-type recombinase/integrase [Paraglaciecola sp. L3A3]